MSLYTFMNFLKRLLFSATITFILICAPYSYGIATVHAQSLSLSISPPLLEVLIKPGKSITQVYTVINNGEPVVITPQLVEYFNGSIRQLPSFTPESWISAVGNDTAFGKPFMLESGRQKQILVSIHPPSDLQDQELYRAVLFTTNPLPPSNSSQSSLVEKIAGILLITVSKDGAVEKSGQITRFALPRFIDSFDRLTATISVKNTGKTYFRPVGEVTLRGLTMGGKGTYPLHPVIIFPDEEKNITADLPLTGKETTTTSYTLSLPGFYIGKYILDTVFTLDESNIKLQQSKVVYALPWKAILGIAILFGMMKVMKRKK